MQRKKTISRTLLLGCWSLFVGGLYLFYHAGFTLQNLDQQQQLWQLWGPWIFIGVFCAMTLLSIPGTPMAILAGVFFGASLGTLYTVIGAMLGALISFLMARHFAADWISSKVAHRGGRIQSMKEGVEKSGWRFVAFVRFVPFTPFALFNYGLGLTRIRLWDFTWASTLFMVPGTFAYAYLGSLGHSVVNQNAHDWMVKMIWGFSLLALTGVAPWLIKRYRKTNHSPATIS